MGKFAVMVALLGITLASGVATYIDVERPGNSVSNRADFSRKVNLALRRTAHHLLRRAGDTTSRIEPVRQLNEHTFVVKLNRSVDYDTLPALLSASFQLHHIQENYDVALLDCARGELQLGYSAQELLDNKEVACGGRKRQNGCYTLQVSFNQPESTRAVPSLGWWFSIGTILIGLGYVVWQKRIRSESLPVLSPVEPESPSFIRLGQSTFDPTTLLLNSGGHSQTLTYREAKLLRFLVSQPNQVIERDAILKAVWEDEGITVGRSVDVFISRLRKLLQNDPTIRLVAVHGIGYRLEVRS